MNCVFAHHVYGLQIELTEDQQRVLSHLLDSPDEANSEEELAMHELAAREAESICARLRESYGIRSKLCGLHIVKDDVYEGSAAESGDCFFGLGVLAFPLVVSEDQAAAVLLRKNDAEWHSWVS